MSTPTATAEKKGDKAPVALRPFFNGTLDLETHTYTKTGTLTAAPQALETYDVRTNGWLDSLWISMETNDTPNTDNNVAYNEDAPENSIQTFTLSDSGGQPLLGPMSGWELGEFVRNGGFSFSDDHRSSTTYAATTGTSTAGGHFEFVLQIPVTFVRREPLGTLPNTNNNTAFQVDITINTLTAIYSTQPDAAPTFTLEIWQDAFRQSSGKDAQGNATVTDVPGKGATLYLLRNTMGGLTSGSVNVELPKQTGSYRTLEFVLRDSNGSRTQGDADWPSPLRIHYNNDVPYDRTKRAWIRKMERQYGYVNAVSTAGGRRYGSFVLPFIDDGGSLKAGSEARSRYWNISAADTLAFDGSIGGSGVHTLSTLFCFVAPPGGNIRALSNR